MELQAKGALMAVKESLGTFEGRAFSSTTFHIAVDLPDNGAGRSIGMVTRPFKFGDAKEFDKWAHLGEVLKKGPIPVLLDIEVSAGADKASVLTLKGIQEISPKKA